MLESRKRVPLAERPEIPAAAYLAEASSPSGCSGQEVLASLADALSAFSLPLEEVLLISSGTCCSDAPAVMRTRCSASAPGAALAAGREAKRAQPALTVIVMLPSLEAVGLGAGDFLAAVREDADLKCLTLRREAAGKDSDDPAGLAVYAGARFAARACLGPRLGLRESLTKLFISLLEHKGFGVADCVCSRSGESVILR